MSDVGCTCQGCGRTYRGDLLVPDDVWERIKPAGKPEGAGLLCAACIMERICELGIWTCGRAVDGDSLPTDGTVKAFFHVSPFKLMVEAETGAFYLEKPQDTDHHEVS